MHQTPLDLENRARLAVSNMVRSVDPSLDGMPYFTYRLFDRPVRVEHGAFDSPHVVGRFLNSLNRIKKTFGIDAPGDFVAGLTRRLYASLDLGARMKTGLAWNEPSPGQRPGAMAHNQREALLGLMGVAELTGSSEALERARALVTDCARHMNGTGRFPDGMLTAEGWQPSNGLDGLPAQSGRMIRALLQFHRLAGDPFALDLALAVARRNLEDCFTEKGTLTDLAGAHIHSITGTITGLLDLGFFLGERRMWSRARQVLENGLAPYYSKFGWVQEMRGTAHARGEANNTGDLLESFLILAARTDASRWASAEQVLRNHLLASQLVDRAVFSGPAGSESPARTSDELRVIDGATGGFFFTSPADYKSHDEDRAPINTDLVGGATEGLCEAVDASFQDDGHQVKIHLLLSRSSPAVTVTSDLPQEHRLAIRLSEPRVACVRVPDHVDPARTSVKHGGKTRHPLVVDGYAFLSETPASGEFTVQFEPIGFSETFSINGSSYEGMWLGETLTRLEGPQVFFRRLYGE